MNLPFGFSLETDFHGDGLLILILLVVGLGFAYTMNKPRQNKQDGSTTWTSRLIVIARSLAYLLLILLVFSPEIVLHRQYSTPKHIAVIIDGSSSMGEAWEGDDEQLKASIVSTIKSLEEQHKVDLWSMAREELKSKDLNFEDALSVFDWTPAASNELDDGELYSHAFLFSDGHLNGGRSPLDQEWTRSLPINIILPLSPKPNASLKMMDLSYIEVGTPESIVIRGKIHQESLLGRRAIARVFTEDDQLLGEEIIPLTQGIQNLNIPIKVGGLEDSQVMLSLSLEDGTLFSESGLEIDQDKGLPGVLIISERVNTLHKFLLQSFADSAYQVQVIVGTEGPGKNTPESEIPEKVDLLILNQLGEFASDQMENIKSRPFFKASLPIIIFNDGNEKPSPFWNSALGVQGIRSGGGVQTQTSFWNDNVGDHAFYLGLLGQGFDPAVLMEYAPLVSGTHSIEMGGDDLMVMGFGDSKQSVFSLRDNPPQALFSGTGFWKWFFHPQSSASFDKFWTYLLVYLDEVSSFKPVQLKLSSSQGQTGTYMFGEIEVKDFDNRQIKAVELRVWQEGEQGIKQVLTPQKNQFGVYQTQLETKYPGEKLIIAEAYRFGELWGRDTSRIYLTGFSGENQSRGVDEVFLSRLASRSGGRVILSGEENFPNIPQESLQRASRFAFRGVHSFLVFGLIVVLLVVEWIWRRRSGLL